MRSENHTLNKCDGTEQYYYLYEIRRKRNPDANRSPFWVAWLLSTDQKFWRYLQPLSDWPRRVHFSPRAWGWLDAAVSLAWIVWGRRCLILDSDLRFCWTVSAPICVHPRVCSEGIWGHLKRQTSCGTGRSRIPWRGKPQPVWGSFWWPRWQSKRTQRQQNGICKYKEATIMTHYDLWPFQHFENAEISESEFYEILSEHESLKQLSLKICTSRYTNLNASSLVSKLRFLTNRVVSLSGLTSSSTASPADSFVLLSACRSRCGH